MAASSIPERPTPRVSANELARYMVSSDTARLGIIRRAKAPQTVLVARYKDVRLPVTSYLTDPNRRLSWLTDGEEMFRQRLADSSLGPLKHDDAQKSIEVLQAIHRMANQLSAFDFQPAPTAQSKLFLGGIEVSVRIDMLVHGASRGRNLIGGAVLRMTQDDAVTDEAREKRRDMGLYVATLAKMQIDQNLAGGREPASRLSMSIDVQHGEVFIAPAAVARRGSDLEAACISIAALWDRV